MSIAIEKLSVVRELKALAHLAIPVFIAQISFTAMGFVDTVMSGHYSEIDLAAIAIATSITLPILLFGQALLFSVTTKAAPLWGRRKYAEAGEILKHGMVLALLSSLPLMGGLVIISNFLHIFGVEENLAHIAQQYQYWIAAALPVTASYQVARSFIESTGQTRPIMYINLFGLLANIPLNALFIYGWGSVPAMGSVGCGLATLLCFVIMLGLLLFFIKYNPRCQKAFKHDTTHFISLSEYSRGIATLTRLGLPIACSMLAEVSLFTVIALLIAPLGMLVIASHQISFVVSSQIFMVPYSQAVALTIRIGQLIGAGNKAHTVFVIKIGIAVSLCISIVTASFVILASANIAALFTENTEISVLAVSLLSVMALYQIPDAIQVVSNGVLRAFEQVIKPLLLIFVAYWFIALPIGYVFSLTELVVIPAMGVKGFWVSLIVGLCLSATSLSYLLFQQVKKYQCSEQV